MDWSLLGCGRSGHVTYAPDEPPVAAQLSATTVTGQAWRCLRCASYVPGPAQATGPARDAPQVRRGLEIRSMLILRIFSVERFLRALIFFGLAVLLWRFKHSQHSIEAAFDRERPILRELFRQLGFNINHSKLVGLIQHALTLSSTALTLLAVGLAAYAVIEIVEGVGLWLGRRWGEYFAMVATSAGLPLEIYDLSHKVTVTALIFLAVNLALVLYLVITKRLFGVRGGKRAYDARLRSDSIMQKATAAATPAAPEAPASPTPASPTPGSPTSEGTPISPAPPTTSAPSAAAPPAAPASMEDTSSSSEAAAEPAPGGASPQPTGRHRATPPPATPAPSAPPASSSGT